MEGGKERQRENRKQESEKDRGREEKKKSTRDTHHTQNHTAVKTVKDSNMEVVWQVLSKSVSGNWEKGDHHRGAALRVTQQHWAGCQGPAQELQGLGCLRLVQFPPRKCF